MMKNWLLNAVIDCECPACHGAVSLDRAAIDGGLGYCPTCGSAVDTRELREVMHQAEWEAAEGQSTAPLVN
jgi:transcription initiation factor IIE alpha subunit